MASSSTIDLHQQSNNSGSVKLCRCGLRAPEWKSLTKKHPGMRFNGCPNYKDPFENCGYFEWVDEFPKRAIDLINEARDEANKLQKKMSKMEVKLSMSKERNAIFQQEIEMLELELKSQVMESIRLKSQNETHELKEKVYLGLIFVLGILSAFFVYVFTNDGKGHLMLP